jgi:hypothetical protein
MGTEQTDKREETCDFFSSNFILRALLLWIEIFPVPRVFSFPAIVYMYIFSRLCVSLVPSPTFSSPTPLLILLIQVIGPPVAGPFLLVRQNMKSERKNKIKWATNLNLSRTRKTWWGMENRMAVVWRGQGVGGDRITVGKIRVDFLACTYLVRFQIF